MNLPVMEDDDVIISETTEEEISLWKNAPSKKRKSDSSNELINQLAQTQSRKLDLLEQLVATPSEQSELDLFFASICKTVAKLNALEQAQLKMEIIKSVNTAEISHLRSLSVDDEI